MSEDPADHNRTVRAGYDALGEVYLAERSVAGPERERIGEFAAALPPGAWVLDAGCGPGIPVAATLAEAGHTVVGLDASREQLRLASERISAGLVQGDLTRLPVHDDAFDALVSLHAVIHVPREAHGTVLAEFARALRPGGRLLVSMGTEPWEGSNPNWLGAGTEMRWSFYGRDSNLKLIRAAGFVVEHEELLEDEIGGGSFMFVRARLEGACDRDTSP